jgi:hypothetical protein
MRDRPFISAREASRPYSEVVADRRALDPAARHRDHIMDKIAELEADAADARADGNVRRARRAQCAAEGLRCGLDWK